MQATSTTATAMPTIQPSTADSGNGAMRARLPPRRVRRKPAGPDRQGNRLKGDVALSAEL